MTLRAYFDQLDSAFFPKRGWAADVNVLKGLSGLGSDSDATRWDANVIFANTVGPHTIQAAFRGAGFLGRAREAGYGTLPWGGFLQQSGYSTGQLLNERFVFGRIAYVHKLAHFRLLEGVYAGISAEVGHYGAPVVPGNPEGTLFSGAAFLAIDSPIGPVYLGYGAGQDGNRSAYLFLGRP